MNITDKNTLKSWFLRGMKPLEAQFAAWIDAYWHKSEKIPTSSINGLEATLNSKAEAADVNNLTNEFATHRDNNSRHKTLEEQAKLGNLANNANFTYATKEELQEMKDNAVIIIPVDFSLNHREIETSIVNFVTPFFTDKSIFSTPVFLLYSWKEDYNTPNTPVFQSLIHCTKETRELFDEKEYVTFDFNSSIRIPNVDNPKKSSNYCCSISFSDVKAKVFMMPYEHDVVENLCLTENGDGQLLANDKNWQTLYNELAKDNHPQISLKTAESGAYCPASCEFTPIDPLAASILYEGKIEISYLRQTDSVTELWVESRVFDKTRTFGGMSSIYQTPVDIKKYPIEDLCHLSADLQAHRDDRANPHQVDKTQIGLPNVDNTADANKPLSLPQREAMNEMRNNLDAKINKHIKNVAYNTATATFTFTFEDDTTAEIDTPIENTVRNGHFDAIANELVLTLTSDEEIRIPAAGLIKVYTGKETSTTTTNVDANGEISVDIKQACIDTAHLSDTLKGEINNHLTKTGDTKHNIVTFAEADTRSNLSSGDTHAAAFGKIKRNITDLHPVAFSGLATDLTDDAAHRLTTDAEKASWNDKYTRAETDTKNAATNTTINDLSADVYHKAETYNKVEINGKDTAVNNAVNALSADVYRKAETYTRTEIDGKDNAVSDTVNNLISNTYRKTETYNQAEIDGKDNAVSNTVNDLISNTYRKTETYSTSEIDSRDSAINNAVNALSTDVYRKAETYTRTEIDSRDSAVTALANSKSAQGHRHAIAEIDNFPNALPASDVYEWAKAPGKPAYSAPEIGAAPVSHAHTADSITETDYRVFLTPAQRATITTQGIQIGTLPNYDNYTETGKYYVFDVPGGPNWQNVAYFVLLEVEKLPNGGIYQTVKSSFIAHDTTASSGIESYSRAYTGSNNENLTEWTKWKPNGNGNGNDIQIGEKASYDDYTEAGKYYVYGPSNSPADGLSYFSLLEVEKLPNGAIYQTVKSSFLYSYGDPNAGEIYINIRAYVGDDFYSRKTWTAWRQIYPCLSGGTPTPSAYTLNSLLSDAPITTPVLPPTTTEEIAIP